MKTNQTRGLVTAIALLALVTSRCSGVTAPSSAISVLVVPGEVNLRALETQMFRASITGDDSVVKGVTWRLSGPACSGQGCGSLTRLTPYEAQYVAPAQVPTPLLVTVTATSIVHESVSGTAAVRTYSPGTITLSVSPTSVTLGSLEKAQFVATVTNDPTGALVNWNVSNCLFCGAVSPRTAPSGSPVTYTAPASSIAGPAQYLTASSSLDPTATAVATIHYACTAATCIP
jgi:hypothetical protein